MSLPLKIKANNIQIISNPEALKILKEYITRESELAGSTSLLTQRLLEYLHKFTKVDPEKAGEFREKLSSLGLRDESIVMIMNICPQGIEELRTLLVYEEKVLDDEVLNKILSLVSEYCIGQE